MARFEFISNNTSRSQQHLDVSSLVPKQKKWVKKVLAKETSCRVGRQDGAGTLGNNARVGKKLKFLTSRHLQNGEQVTEGASDELVARL